MKGRFLLALVILAAAAPAFAQGNGRSGKYTICLMPFGCGASGDPAWQGPKPEAGEKRAPESAELPGKEPGKKLEPVPPSTYPLYPDPLADKTLEHGEITSAVRLSPEQSGSEREQIVVIRRGEAELGLPATLIPNEPAKGAAEPEEVPAPKRVAGKSKAVRQINSMRGKRPAASDDAKKAKTSADRMFGEKSAR